MKYFAYGSNMLTKRLRTRVPSAQPLGRATLSGHELRWHKRSIDGSGKCDVFRTGQVDAVVWGVLFSIPTDEKPDLDAAEGAGSGYRELTVVVEFGRESVEAITYLAERTHINNALRPYDWYKALVLAGAREHDLPRDYVAALEARETKADQNSSRAKEVWDLLECAGGA